MRGAALLLGLLLACSGKGDDDGTTVAPAPEPGELRVGVSRVRMPVPVGIGTAGYGGFGVPSEPTPFADIYPATTRVHEHPDFRAIAISRGPGFEVVFLRTDTVGVFQQLRRAVVLELNERLGRDDFDDVLVVGATHTHSGPGRVIDAGGPFELIADSFFPEFYEAVVDAMADAVEQALADARPGRVGWTFGRSDEGIDDRRCEDGLTYVNGTLPVLAVEQEGELAALMLAYPIHGTVLDISDLTLSQDVSGAIEQAVEDRFDHPVQVQMFNAWGADMSPGSPTVALQEGTVQPDGYDRMEEVGQVVADAVGDVIDALVWSDAPEVVSETHRTRIDREVIGYDSGEFDYAWGGVYCGSSTEADCDASTTIDDLDSGCIPFPETFPAPTQTELSAGRVGDLHFLTFPGEPGTLLAEQVLAEVQASTGVSEVMFLGYTQDYLGYSILEDDWWQGGYEASGALWGPRQGEYLADEAVAVFEKAFADRPDGEEPPPVEPFGGSPFEPYAPPEALGVGEVVLEVPEGVAPTDEVVFTVRGRDPWLGTPVATLERDDGTPVLRPGGQPVTSDGLAFWVELEVTPSWGEDAGATSRAFHWSFHLPVTHAVVGAAPELEPGGTYRIRVTLPDEAGGADEVSSAAFTVEG